MTKRDFELIAKVLRSSVNSNSDALALIGEAIAYQMSEAFLDTNPRFDQVRFLTACGVLT